MFRNWLLRAQNKCGQHPIESCVARTTPHLLQNLPKLQGSFTIASHYTKSVTQQHVGVKSRVTDKEWVAHTSWAPQCLMSTPFSRKQRKRSQPCFSQSGTVHGRSSRKKNHISQFPRISQRNTNLGTLDGKQPWALRSLGCILSLF